MQRKYGDEGFRMKKQTKALKQLLMIGSLFSIMLSAQLFAHQVSPNCVRRVPEPGTLELVAVGLVSLGFYAKKKLGKKQ
jgi:hypothetical protein